jgi:hypothetical protein
MNKFILVLVSVFMFSLSSVSSTFADEETMVTTTSVEMVSVTEVSVEEEIVEESTTKAQDYNSSRSNKARGEVNSEDKNPNIVRERAVELRDIQVRGQAKKEHVLEAVELRKQHLRELQAERKQLIEAKVKKVSVQKRNQFI